MKRVRSRGAMPSYVSVPKDEGGRMKDESHQLSSSFILHPSSFQSAALAIFAKDVRAELRNRAALNAILLFAITALVVIAFAVGKGDLSPVVKAALLWIVLFFAVFARLAHVFIHEEETSTSTALRLASAPGAVY